MSRRHPPQLVRPSDVVHAAMDRQLGITSQRAPDQRISAAERIIAQHDTEIGTRTQRLRDVTEQLDDISESLGGVGGPPVLDTESAAGSTASITEDDGNDEAGVFTLVPGGSGIASGTILSVEFARPRGNARYHVSLTPLSAAARTVGWSVSVGSRSAAGFTIFSDVALTSGATYRWSFGVRGW